ncbi:MAG: biotin/lipoyl-containing protein, partial [Thermonemataceae bacterium]|nr:biotin/lipoyl-containing protein [Thermonemataceae bacterium]
MAQIIQMPKMSDTMTEGVIATWHKKVGDSIKAGEIIAEVETDKATMDLEAYEAGTILYIGAQAGQAVPVDGVLYIVGKAGEAYEHLLGANTEKPIEKVATAPTEVSHNHTSNPIQKADLTAIKAKVERMPKMSDTMTEGVIVAWHKKVGDTIKAGDLLAEIETDKAVMELEAYEKGTLLYVGVEAGGKVAVDEVLYVVGETNADWKMLLETAPNTIQNQSAAKEDLKTTIEINQESVVNDADGRVKASPLAKKIAQELGYDLKKIQGTGDGGRITKTDVENYKPSSSVTATSLPKEENKVETPKSTSKNTLFGEDFEEVPVSQMRKTIARRLSESKFTAP